MAEIRLATPADAPGLARLRYEFRAALNNPAEDREHFIARCAPWMAERLGEGSAWRCWVAEAGGAIRGHLWLQLIEKVPNPAPERELHGYITNVYVQPGARGDGTGAALLDAALAYCREAGVDSVILWPTERSQPLYARHGFDFPRDLMEAVLDPGRDLH
jgi:GNAT superfamily N-acetyltransferase